MNTFQAQPEECPRCLKPLKLCMCDAIPALKNKIHVLILQHPQEPDIQLGTAKIAQLALAKSTLKVGLSWPNLTKALGEDYKGEIKNSDWAVLYLGSGLKDMAEFTAKSRDKDHLLIATRTKTVSPESAAMIKGLKGIVILDGTWSQAKALWWRNAWLLKLKRAVLLPSSPSLYKNLRKEPRRECLSSIETIARSLDLMGEPKEISNGLTQLFGELLTRFQAR